MKYELTLYFQVFLRQRSGERRFALTQRFITPYWYAEEMLTAQRGALVPFRDPQAKTNGNSHSHSHTHRKDQDDKHHH